MHDTQATGLAIIIEMSTQSMYCFDKSKKIWFDFAPFAFRIPISFVFRSVINEESPISPKHEIKTANREKQLNILRTFCSVWYWSSKSLSIK